MTLEDRDFMMAMFAERDRQYAERFVSQEKALSKADAGHERRLESMNEFRGQLKDVLGTMMPRQEYFLAHETLRTEIKNMQDRMEVLNSRIYQITGKSEGATWLWGLIVGVAGLATAIVVAFLTLLRH